MMHREPAPVLWMGLAFGVAAVLAGLVLADQGAGAAGIGMALRGNARWSFVLFWMAYAGGALAVLLAPAFAPMLVALGRRGREFGLAFAAAHLVHLGLVLWLFWILRRPPLTGFLLAFFAIGIVWTYLLAGLSFGGFSHALGSTVWRTLRILGMNYILLAFARDFVPAVLHADIGHRGFWYLANYVPFAALSIAAPILTVAAANHRWRTRHAAA